MKTPIKFATGDVIIHAPDSADASTWLRHPDGKWRSGRGNEWADDVAARWIAVGDGRLIHVAHRPKPAVVLPTEPTLGWIDALGEKPLALVGVRKPGDVNYPGLIYMRITPNGGWDSVKEITAFTPAVAVPADALDDLRTYRAVEMGIHSEAQWAFNRAEHIDRFLAAVDEANGDA